ncbi:hypothetical protein PCL_02972 [Purpureocillium lilacinum]|uniref:Uncharacterized protein n=1 Tax=Purpureocillium lilacinum TaxID=33203 RepID=A0A2U3DZD2_PURLI|nr:hypothetical protein PCL_02972 [Purpureocillium lilacinum]
MASAARVSPKFAAYASNVLLGRDVSTVLKLLSEVAVDAVEQVIPSEVARTAQSSRGTCWGPTLGTASLIARRSDWGCGVAFLGRGSFATFKRDAVLQHAQQQSDAATVAIPSWRALHNTREQKHSARNLQVGDITSRPDADRTPGRYLGPPRQEATRENPNGGRSLFLFCAFRLIFPPLAPPIIFLCPHQKRNLRIHHHGTHQLGSRVYIRPPASEWALSTSQWIRACRSYTGVGRAPCSGWRSQPQGAVTKTGLAIVQGWDSGRTVWGSARECSTPTSTNGGRYRTNPASSADDGDICDASYDDVSPDLRSASLPGPRWSEPTEEWPLNSLLFVRRAAPSDWQPGQSFSNAFSVHLTLAGPVQSSKTSYWNRQPRHLVVNPAGIGRAGLLSPLRLVNNSNWSPMVVPARPTDGFVFMRCR